MSDFDDSRASVLRRLDRQYVASLAPGDNFLDFVALLGRLGPGLAVVLVADGIMYMGAVGASSQFLSVLTAAYEDALEPGLAPPTRQAILDAVRDLDAGVEARREQLDEVMARYTDIESIDDIALQDVQDYYRAALGASFINLHDVSVYYGSGEPVRVSNIRLNLERVSAWWPARAQGIDVNYVFHERPANS